MRKSRKSAEDTHGPGSNRMGRRQREQLSAAGTGNSEIQRGLRFPSVKVLWIPGLLPTSSSHLYLKVNNFWQIACGSEKNVAMVQMTAM